ncbi:hypothetical protein ANN_20566 [Periplaneta americana]|uniref:Uncharacterized protein n=1 Tax=Periplaneta americana TaxID=6978 RepID=A0ABQ8SDC4_PERAM|nr:hypothetical protein ANN_20566 [Periplaneta americana]
MSMRRCDGMVLLVLFHDESVCSDYGGKKVVDLKIRKAPGTSEVDRQWIRTRKSAVKKSERIYKTIILPVVLYGCETWTLTLREEQKLRVFENKVLRIIFGAKRDEVTGEWRKLHNAELHELYPSPDIIGNIKSRRLRWAGHVARMGESRNAYRVLVGRPEGKIPLGRPRRRWEDNIKMDLREVGYDDREWINLAQDRDHWRAYVRAAMNLRFLKSQKVKNVLKEMILKCSKIVENKNTDAVSSRHKIAEECNSSIHIVEHFMDHEGASYCCTIGVVVDAAQRDPIYGRHMRANDCYEGLFLLIGSSYQFDVTQMNRFEIYLSESWHACGFQRMTIAYINRIRTHRHDTTVHDVIRLLIPVLYKNQSDSLMAADGDCHHLCKLMAPVRHRWSISDVIVEIRNTVMPSDCSALRFGIRS